MDLAKIQRFVVKPAVIALCVADGIGYFVAREHLGEPPPRSATIADASPNGGATDRTDLPIATFALPQLAASGHAPEDQFVDRMATMSDGAGQGTGRSLVQPSVPPIEHVAVAPPRVRQLGRPEFGRKASRSAKLAFSQAFPARFPAERESSGPAVAAMDEPANFQSGLPPPDGEAEITEAPNAQSQDWASEPADPVFAAELPVGFSAPQELNEPQAGSPAGSARQAPFPSDATAVQFGVPSPADAPVGPEPAEAPAHASSLSRAITPTNGDANIDAVQQSVESADFGPQAALAVPENLPGYTAARANGDQRGHEVESPASVTANYSAGHDLVLADSSPRANLPNPSLDRPSLGDLAGGCRSPVGAPGPKSCSYRIDYISAGAAIYGDQLSVRLGDVLDALKPAMDQAEFDRMSRSRSSDTFVTLETLRNAGIAVRYEKVRGQLILG